MMYKIAMVDTGFAPKAQHIKANKCAPNMMGSKVLITPKATHLLEIGRNACVPYELKMSTNTCKNTAKNVQSHKWRRLASGKISHKAPEIKIGHSKTAGME